MIEIVPISSEEFAAFDKLHNRADLDDKTSRRMLTESRVTVMSWGISCIGLKLDNELVSINVTNFSKSKRKNAWGRYLNFYLAYTVPAYRFKGYATQVVQYIEHTALERGYNRMKSLAGSYAGVRLHMGLGHHFYGIGKKGALVVDTPLRTGDSFPDGIPIEARGATIFAHRMGLEELTEVIRKPPFEQELSFETLMNYTHKIRL